MNSGKTALWLRQTTPCYFESQRWRVRGNSRESLSGRCPPTAPERLHISLSVARRDFRTQGFLLAGLRLPCFIHDKRRASRARQALEEEGGREEERELVDLGEHTCESCQSIAPRLVPPTFWLACVFAKCLKGHAQQTSDDTMRIRAPFCRVELGPRMPPTKCPVLENAALHLY